MKEHIKFYHKGDVRVTEFSKSRLETFWHQKKRNRWSLNLLVTHLLIGLHWLGDRRLAPPEGQTWLLTHTRHSTGWHVGYPHETKNSTSHIRRRDHWAITFPSQWWYHSQLVITYFHIPYSHSIWCTKSVLMYFDTFYGLSWSQKSYLF